MLVYALRRAIPALITMLAMVVIVFIGTHVMGNPVDVLGAPDLSQEERAAMASRMGLDRPLLAQFGHFVANAAQGDLGSSFVHGTPALSLIAKRLPATLELAVCAILLALVLGIPLGLLAGLRPDSAAGKLIMSGSILGFSLPTFWIGMMFILLFSVTLGWFPAGGRGATQSLLGLDVSFLSIDGLRRLALPALTLALYKLALVIRLAQSGTREVVRQDYIRNARAKGLTETRVVFVHVLKNIAIPIVTVLGLEFGSLIAFSVVTETVFSWPGMGKLLIDSIMRSDRPVIVAYMLVTVVMFITINLAVDIVYSLLDPRVRLKAAGA